MLCGRIEQNYKDEASENKTMDVHDSCDYVAETSSMFVSATYDVVAFSILICKQIR